MFKRSVIFKPEYEWNNLSEKQYRAMRTHMQDYYEDKPIAPNVDWYVGYRGGKVSTGYYFVLYLNETRYSHCFRRATGMLDSYIILREMLKRMDKIAQELDEIRKANEEEIA